MQAQPQEIVFDESQEIISLDKSVLSFNINPNPMPDQSGIYGKSECIILVKNHTNSHVAIRTKTTKKDVYAVNPTYGIINPLQTFEIKFVYYIKDLKENPKKHKFKFEGIVIDPANPVKDSKSLFDYFISSQTKVKGTAIRREVVFNFGNANFQAGGIQNIGESNLGNRNSIFQGNVATPNEADNFLTRNLNNANTNNANILNSPNAPNEPNLFIKNEAPFQPNLNVNTENESTSRPPNKELEKQLQDMKIEYYKYKHQLNNLTETYKNLKSRADIEKKTPDSNTISGSTFTVSQSYKEEKQIKKNTVLILFVISVFLGFLLSR